MALAATALAAAMLVWAAIARATAPTSNTDQTRFDAIIVLGAPADADGNPTPEELARVNEGVHEYERDVAPWMIFTGGPTRNTYEEAQVMARAAEAEGIPASSIFLEPRAMDTIHNACYSVRLMKAHGWHSAEVISSGYHLPRAGIIFNRLPVEWRAHAAPALEPESSLQRAVTETREMLSMVHYLVYAQWAEACTP
jgi:uncharacterized SAM-binding protein YcdF (DUF218 family)